jgi:menaquinone-specific isochorismate synthase
MRRDDPARAEWDRMLRWALGAFEPGDPGPGQTLGKVVLARRARFLFEEAVDPIALLRRLEAATPRCYHALVAPGSGAAFLTATPERLLRLDGRELLTEAVAGTRPRAEADAADDLLRAELLDSEKDRREHAFVRDAIVGALTPLATEVEVDSEAAALTLARGRHLRTGIRATLAKGVGVTDLLRALHPTPAVGGTPTAAALDAIDRLEPFDRGLYAGPIGWVGRDAEGREAADLAVGIRSGLVAGRSLSLYSGAGIVAGSDPASEWAEIEHKIGDFARVLGLTDRVDA